MGLMAKNNEGPEREPIPEGLYLGVCYLIADLGTHTDERWNKDIRKVQIGWEIPELPPIEYQDKDTGERISRRQAVWKRYTLSLHEKAALRKHLESWRGKAFTQDELYGFDLQKVLGASCQLQIIHNTSDKSGKVYANVANVIQVPKGTTAVEVKNELQWFSFDELLSGQVSEITPGIPEWMQNVIKESHEWDRFTGDDMPVDEPHGGLDEEGNVKDEPDSSMPF